MWKLIAHYIATEPVISSGRGSTCSLFKVMFGQKTVPVSSGHLKGTWTFNGPRVALSRMCHMAPCMFVSHDILTCHVITPCSHYVCGLKCNGAYLDSSLWVVSQVGRKKTEEYPIISHQILFEDRGVPSEILPWHFAKSRLISLRADCFIRYVFELFSWTPRMRHHPQQSPMIMPSTRDPMVLLLGVLKKQCNMPHHSDFVHTTSTDTGSHRYVGRCFFGISACTSSIVSTQIFVMCVVRRAQEPFISFLRGEERALRFRPRPHVPMRSTPMSRTELGKCSTLILQG